MIEFNLPARATGDGTLTEPAHESIIVSEPSEWTTQIQTYVAKMGKDSEYLTDLNPSARAQTIQTYNALVDKMSEVYNALSTNGSVENIECQVRNLYLDVVNLSSKFTTGLYTNLANSKKKTTMVQPTLAVNPMVPGGCQQKSSSRNCDPFSSPEKRRHAALQ